MLIASLKTHLLTQLYAVWIDLGGKGGIEFTLAVTALLSVAAWAITWQTQRQSRRYLR